MRLIESSLLSKVALAGFIYTLYMGWTIGNGVPAVESVASLFSLTAQTMIGLIIVRQVACFDVSTLETIAIAFSVGSMISTVLDQLLIFLSVDLTSWLSQMSLLFVLIVSTGRQERPFLPTPESFDHRLLAVMPLIIMSGYGVFSRGWWLALIFPAVAWLFTFKSQVSQSLKKTFALSLLGTLGCLLTLVVARPATPTYGDWLLRPLYTGSDDFVFSESLSWSLSRFGITDYAAAIGTSVRYHWFSLAWSGLMAKMMGATPFVTTLHVAPTVAFMIMPWLIFALTSLVGYRRRVGAMAVTILFGTGSVVDPTRFYHVLNTSNVVPFVWVLLVPIALVLHQQKCLRGSHVVLPLLVGVVLLAKAPFGVAVLFGALTSLFMESWRTRSRHTLLLPLNIGLVSVSTYLVFLSPHTWERRQYTATWNLANLALNSTFYPLIPLLLIACILATLFIGALGIIGKRHSHSQNVLFIFLCSSALVGALRFIMSGGSAELYFFNMTMLCAAVLSGIGLVSELDKVPGSHFVTPVALAIIAFFSMKIEIDRALLAQVISRQAALIMFPIGIAIASVFAFAITSKIFNFLRILPLRGIFIVATLAASSAVLFNTLKQPEKFTSTTEVASVEDVAALSWLRESSSSNSIVATNRFLCPSPEPCSYDDSSFLISAVARRRVLVEGPRFVIGGRPYPQWMTDRIKLSTRFAEQPNEEDFQTLKDYGVSWFVVSERFLQTQTLIESDWSKFGTIRYHRDGIAIIELRS